MPVPLRHRLAAVLKPFTASGPTFRDYSTRKLRRDLLAGLTVAVVEVPQAMAYAIIAGVPPVYGIYTSVLQGILGALLSSGQHVTTGPTNTQSLLIASAVSRIAGLGSDQYLQLVFALTLMKGLLQLGFAAFNLGTLVRYVSRSVIVGVTAGAGVLIAAGQLAMFMGIETTARRLPGVVGMIDALLMHLRAVNWHAVTVGVVSLAIILGVRAINRFLPAAFLAVIIGGVFVAAMGWTDGRVRLIGELPRGLPGFALPDVSWADASALFGGALALAILGSLESVAIAKSLAERTGERVDANQDFFAQGLTNTLSSFFQCIPGSVSFTRSALDVAAGAETRLAAVFNGLFVAVIFLCLAPLASYIPLASLSAVLLVIAVGLVDVRYMLRVWRTHRSDAVVLLVTFAAACVAPLEYAIFIGVGCSILAHLRRASRLHMTEMVPIGGGRFGERPLAMSADQITRPWAILQFEGDLFFGVADELHDRLKPYETGPVRVLVVRMLPTHSIDLTAMTVLGRFVEAVRARGGHVLFCGVRPPLYERFMANGLIDTIGEANVFRPGAASGDSAQEALRRAAEILGISPDDLQVTGGPATWAYDI